MSEEKKTEIKTEWTIVGFRHPIDPKSRIYRQNLKTRKGLLNAIEKGIDEGCNLFSIRGFHYEYTLENGILDIRLLDEFIEGNKKHE